MSEKINGQAPSTGKRAAEEIYDILRELNQTGNSDLKEAIGNMLKAINFSQNKNEITSALSSNLKFLSEYFSPNRALSQNLESLAQRWISGEAETNFTALRNQTADLMKIRLCIKALCLWTRC